MPEKFTVVVVVVVGGYLDFKVYLSPLLVEGVRSRIERFQERIQEMLREGSEKGIERGETREERREIVTIANFSHLSWDSSQGS